MKNLNMKTDTPNITNLNDIVILDELWPLIDHLARAIHEIWANERMSSGWVYGEIRNDNLKTNPCLVPFDMLSPQEQDLDRMHAMLCLKLIIKFGYDIKPKESDTKSSNRITFNEF